MAWHKWENWFLAGFLFSIAMIGIQRQPFDPGRIAVRTDRPLRLDFADQKVRVIGWEHDYAAITVSQTWSGVALKKAHYCILAARDGSIGLKKAPLIHGYNMPIWFLGNMESTEQLSAYNFQELNGLTVYTIKVPRHQPVILRGKVLHASGCRVVRRII